MINLSPSQIGGIATLFVAFQISNMEETQRVINQLNQIAKLNGTTVTINLRTKSDGVAIKSLIKPIRYLIHPSHKPLLSQTLL